MRPTLTWLALICVLLACPGLAPAAAAAPPSDLFLEWLSGWENPFPARSGDAMRYGLDPETGEWGHPGRGGAPLFGSMVEGEDQSVLLHLPDGSIVVYPDPRLFSDLIVVRVGEDGALHVDCANPAAAVWMLSRPAGAPPEQ